MAWIGLAAAAASAAAGVYGSNAAADASKAGGKKALDLQRQMYANALAINEPSRALGYGADYLLGQLYGIPIPEYQPLDSILGRYATPQTVGGDKPSSVGPARNALRAATFGIGGSKSIFGSDQRIYGGTIDPTRGTVDVKGGGQKADDLMTNYLRTGEWGGSGKGKKYKRLMAEVDRIRAAGWEYDPNAPEQPAPVPQVGGTGGTGGYSGQNMLSVLQQLPGYQFGLAEGGRAVERSAAARSGIASGSAMRAINQFGQDYAGTKLMDEFNRLNVLAGRGAAGTAAATGAAQTYGNNAGMLQQQIGDTRASGITGAGNSISNAIGNYMLYRQNQQNQPSPYNYSSWRAGGQPGLNMGNYQMPVTNNMGWFDQIRPGG